MLSAALRSGGSTSLCTIVLPGSSPLSVPSLAPGYGDLELEFGEDDSAPRCGQWAAGRSATGRAAVGAKGVRV